jgi:hypothetical protein
MRHYKVKFYPRVYTGYAAEEGGRLRYGLQEVVMGMSLRLKEYLDRHQIPYDMVHHAYSEGAAQSAIAGHVPLAQMAKAVILERDDGKSVTEAYA